MLTGETAIEKSLESTRSKFDKALTGLRLLLTRAPQYFLPFWYGKEPLFWLPHGWFPYWAEWIISFPRAPLGSVSSASWQLACTGIMALVIDGVVGIIGATVGGKAKEAPVPAAAPSAAGKKGEKTKAKAAAAKGTSKEKKEL